MAQRRSRRVTKNTVEKIFDNWSGGLNTLVPPVDVKKKEVTEALNWMLTGDVSSAKWTKRFGDDTFGDENDSRVRGGINYNPTGGDNVILRASGNSIQYIDSDGVPTDLTGKTYTADLDMRFARLRDNVYFANGTEALSYTDDGTTIKAFTQLSTPAWHTTALTRGAGLSAGDYTVSYRVSAVNDVGETLASASEDITVDITPDLWDEADEYVQLEWVRNTDSACEGYKIYGRSQDGVGEAYMTFIPQPTSGTNVTFQDTGSDDYPVSLSNVPLLANTTGGQIFDIIFGLEGRLYGVDWDTDESQMWFSAGGELPHSFLITDGGGWIRYSAGDGDKITTVFDVAEQIIVAKGRKIGKFSLSFVSGIAIPSIVTINNDVGVAGPNAWTRVNNDVVALSLSKQLRVVGQEAGFFGAIRVGEISILNRNILETINDSYIERSSVGFYKNLIVLSYPRGGSTVNNYTYCVDIERGFGAFEWDIGGFSFFRYVDDDGQERAMTCSETDGYIEEWLLEDKTTRGEPVSSSVVGKVVDFDTPYSLKRFREFTLNLRQISGTLMVTLTPDYTPDRALEFTIAESKDIGGFGTSAYMFSSFLFGTSGSTGELQENLSLQKVVDIFNEAKVYSVNIEHNTKGDVVLVDYGLRADKLPFTYKPTEYIWN